MVDYPNTPKPSTLDDFLKKIPERPEPDVVTRTYLRSLGYTSSNDWQIVPILRFIKFIESNGKPTDLFKNFSDITKSKVIMAQALKESYAELFKVHTNPCDKDDTDLKNFFRTQTGKGKKVVERTVSTFKTLCQFADFGAPVIAPTPISAPTPAPTLLPTPVVQLPVTKEGGVTINLNIRLELPATQDADVYDKIFQSLKKHLLTQNSKTD